jgi:TRAP-type mannitol/chloroaromatic compound transport system permease small subunit
MPIFLRALRWLDAATQGANIFGTILIVGLVAIICIDVLGREIFGAPLPGVPEMVSLSIVAIVFVQLPQAFKAGRLTRSDGVIMAVHRRLPRLGAAMETLFELTGAAVIGILLYAHWPILTRSITRGDFVGSVGNVTFPTWPVKVMIFVGATLLFLQFLARIARRFARIPSGAPHDTL